jgi:dTDP-4-amino-4,6-dideoxygalactose transaminase
MKVPFHKVQLTGRELEYIEQAFFDTHTYGDGAFGKKCEKALEQAFQLQRALLTCSGTAALELASLLFDIKSGDEVIMPSFTFVSTANAVLLRGATPVFVDIRPDTLNLDERALDSAFTNKTRGIMPVHYAGVSCEMDSIMAFAKERNLFVLEDAAHCYGARYKGKALGTIGDLGMISFHQTKNVGCGEGGALFINDQKYIERAEIMREKGTDRSKFLRGEVDKYSWSDIGSSYVLSDILAAFLYAQMEQAQEITDNRVRIFKDYLTGFQPFAAKYGLVLPTVPAECEANGHIFYVILPNSDLRDGLINHLRGRSINAVTHYVPLHSSLAGGKYARSIGSLPVTVNAASCLIRLPSYAQMSSEEVSTVIEEVLYFLQKG